MLRDTPSFQWMNKSSHQLTSFLFLKQTLFSILYIQSVLEQQLSWWVNATTKSTFYITAILYTNVSL